MPDESNSAQFNELFALTVDTEAFAAGLNQLRELYANFLKELGSQASGVIGVGVFAGIQAELEKLSSEVAAFHAESQQVADDAALAVQRALSLIDQQEEAYAEKRAARVKKSAEDSIAAQQQSTPKSDSPVAGAESLSALEASLVAVTSAQERFNASREEAAAIATKLDTSGIAQQTSGYSELSIAYAKLTTAQEKLLLMEEEGLAGDTAFAKANVQLASSFDAAAKAQERLIAGREKLGAFGAPAFSSPDPRSEVALNARRVRPGEEIDAAQVAATTEYNKLLEQQAVLQDRINALRVRVGETTDATQIAATYEYNKLLQEEAALEEKVGLARSRAGEQSGTTPVEYTAEYNKLLQEQIALQERISTLRAGSAQSTEAAQIGATAQYNALLQQEASLQEKLLNLKRVRAGESVEAAQSAAIAQNNTLLEREVAAKTRLQEATDSVTAAQNRLNTAQERATSLANAPVGKVSTSETKALQDQVVAAESLIRAQERLNTVTATSTPNNTVGMTQIAKATSEVTAATDKLASAIENVNRLRAVKTAEDVKPKQAVEAERVAVEQLTAARQRLNEVRAQQTATGGGASPDLSAAYRQEAEAAERVNAAHQQVNQSLAQQKGNVDGVLGGLAESAVRLAKIYVLWNAINDVIRVITETVTAPFKAFEEGFNFLKETELNADKLTGVLASNVKFSEDMAKNFQMASESAGHVVLALRDVSVELKLPYDQLAKVFSALVDSGAAQTVSSMRDLVTLTTDFALAFRAAGREGNAIRSLVSQLPLLFEGNVKSTSAIAEALHMSSEELSTMVANAKTHKDLVEQLEPRLQGLIAGSKEMAGSFQATSAALQEQLKRLEGIAALNVFDRMKAALEAISALLKENQGPLEAWANYLGQVARLLVDSAGHIVGILAGTTSAGDAAKTLADNFVFGLKGVTAFLETIVAIAKVTYDIIKLGNPFATSEDSLANIKDIKHVFDEFKQSRSEFKDLSDTRTDLSSPSRSKFESDIKATKDSYNQKLSDVRKGEADLSITRAQGTKMLADEAQKQKTILAQSLADYEKDIEDRKVSAKVKDDLIGQAQRQFTKATGGDELAAPIQDAGGRPDLSKTGKQPKEDFNLELARIKSFYADAQNAVKEGEANLGITRATAVALLESLGEREKADINNAVATYRAALQTQTGDAKKRNEDLTALEAERLNLLRGVQSQTNRGVNSTNKAFDQNDSKEAKTQLETQLQDIKAYYQEQSNVVKEGEAALIISKREGAALTANLASQEKILQSLAIDNFERYIQTTIKDYKLRNEIIANAEKERKALIAGADQNVAVANKGAASESAQVDLIQLRASLSLKKQALQEQFQYEQELGREGKLTQTQLLDEKTAEEKKAFDSQIASLDQELAHVDGNTARWAELFATRSALEQKYTADVQLRAAQRISASEQELREARQATEALKTLQLQRSTVESEISNQGATVPKVNLTPFANRSAELDLKQKELQLQLQYNQAHGIEKSVNDKVIEQLQQISNQRLSILHDQLGAIAGSNEPEVIKKQDSQNAIKSQISENLASEVQDVLNGDMESLKRHTDAVGTLTNLLVQFQPSLSDALNSFEQKLFGFNLGDKLSEAEGGIQKLGVGAAAVGNAVKEIGNIIGDVQSGLKKGGVLGGVGAGLTDVGGFIPGPVGAVVSAVGSVLSLVGSLFTAAAQHIADEIKKDFSTTMERFSTGQATLIQTLQAVQQEEQSAIARLSGRKGGQDQLDQLLPQLNNEIDALKKQQLDLITNFNTQLSNLKLQSDTLSGIAQQWQSINKQVTDYIGAGGDAAKAQEFLQLSLQNIQKNAQQQLNSANDTAIQDAINLNSLLLQRNQLQASFLDQQFAITNGDSIERRQGDISKAIQLEQIKTQHDIDLANINSEIDLTTKKVAAESKVFSIATDITTLHQQDNALQLSALNLQIQGWTDLKKIIESISSGKGLGSLGISTGLTPQQTTTIGNITINVTPPPGTDPKAFGKAIGNSLSDELQRRLRQGNH